MNNQASAILETLPSSINDLVKRWSDEAPDRPALLEASGRWTYGELQSAVTSAKAWLLERGVRRGDRVMILGENCRAFVAIFLGSIAIDAWPVVVNPRLSAEEVGRIEAHCGARLVVYVTSASPLTAEHARTGQATIADFLDAGPVGFGPLGEHAEPEALQEDIPNRVAALIYTSGTTGQPKGVMLTHRNLLFVAAVSAKLRNLAPEDRLYGILPMTHIVGLTVVLLGALLSGASVYLSSRFDAMSARATLEKEKLTIMLGPPALYAQMTQYAKLRGIALFHFPALRVISSAGAPLSLSLKSNVERLFGQVLHNGYGITECSPNISQTRIESPRTDTSVGSAIPGVEIKLVRSDGATVPEGEVGEVWVRGPNVMKGYYRSPEETAAAVNREGWFNSRDLGRIEDGSLFLVGRAKEMIVRFGFNVYPAEVEAVLNAHPLVVQSAVVGRSLEENEEIVAFVQLAPGARLTTLELAEYASHHLGLYKRPSEIVFLEAMPLTSIGKIAKGELSKRAQRAPWVAAESVR